MPVIAPAEAVTALPDDLSTEEAAPLLCAGITVYNPLRNSGARPGDVVAVQGIGGLGHLGIQCAGRMGFRTIAIGSGGDKEPRPGSWAPTNTSTPAPAAPAEAIQKLEGARGILATAPDAKTISALVDGLAPSDKLVIVGVTPDTLSISPQQLIMARRSIQGWPSGSAKDSEDTLQFAALTGVRPMIERYPLEKAPEGYEQMISGKRGFAWC